MLVQVGVDVADVSDPAFISVVEHDARTALVGDSRVVQRHVFDTVRGDRKAAGPPDGRRLAASPIGRVEAGSNAEGPRARAADGRHRNHLVLRSAGPPVAYSPFFAAAAVRSMTLTDKDAAGVAGIVLLIENDLAAYSQIRYAAGRDAAQCDRSRARRIAWSGWEWFRRPLGSSRWPGWDQGSPTSWPPAPV